MVTNRIISIASVTVQSVKVALSPNYLGGNSAGAFNPRFSTGNKNK